MDNTEILAAINKIAAEGLGYTKGKAKGTSYWYYVGNVGNKSACYTRAKTHYQGRFGFWSWIQTSYKKGKLRKRTKFALSASKKKAKARAERLFKQLEIKYGKEEKDD